MTDKTAFIAFIIGIPLLLLMRWTHRAWGRAFLATLFAPLVAIPMGLVGVLGCTFLLRVLNAPFAKMDRGMSDETLGLVSTAVTTTMILFLLILYVRDQRHLSAVNTGPRLGVRQTFSAPTIGLRRRIR